MVDFHTHILPGIDDGSPDVQTSLAMLAMEAAQGIRTVAATPHFQASFDAPDAFLARRAQAAQLLRSEMAKQPDLPELILGAEVLFFRGMSDSECLPLLTLGGGRHLLVEMPPAPWPQEHYRELEAIWEKRRLVPVIAHIDRYIRPFRTFGIPKRLAGTPVWVQANTSFFLEKRTAGMAMKMLKAGQIQILGSDCHNLSSRRPNLGTAEQQIRRRLGNDALEQIRGFEEEILRV